MMDPSNIEAAASLFDSTGHSTFALAEKENLIEQLKRKLRILENENAELRSTLPRLKDAQGKDCTGEMIKLERELLLAKEQCERLRCELAQENKKYGKLEQATIANIDNKDKEIKQLKHQAMEMEEEIEKLREGLDNEKSRVWHMQHKEFGNQLATPKAQILAGVLKADHRNSKVSPNVELVDESLCKFNPNDVDQIAAHLLMILETLDKTQRDSNELQEDIFAFMTARGINSNDPLFEVLSSIFKKVTDRRLAEIRARNEQLRANVSVDEDVEACMKHLQDSSVTLSSMPSFAGFSKENALPLEMSSVPESEHNLTVGSVALAGRTSTLLEACVRMFERLRGTGEFFQNLLKMFGVTAEDLGEDIVSKIEAIKLDVDFSIKETQSMLSEAKAILHEQSQMAVSFNSMNSSMRDDSKLGQQLSEGGVVEEETKTPTTTKSISSARDNSNRKLLSDDGTIEEEAKTPITTKFVSKNDEISQLKLSLDEQRAAKEAMEERIATMEETFAQIRTENGQLLRKVQELEVKPCEKCAELNNLLETTKAKLDSELTKTVELTKCMDLLHQQHKVLQEESERISSVSKENMFSVTADLKEKLVEQSRTELNKIYDTMSYTVSSFDSVVGGSSRDKKKGSKTGKKEPKKAGQQQK